MERRKRRWWTRGITWLSLIAISGALVSGLFQLAVALAPGTRDDIARRASVALGQPVEVDAVALRWRWLWPLLELDGVRLLDAGGVTAMAVRRIRLGFALGALVRGEWVPAEVEVTGVALSAEITPEGEWRLRGRDSSREAPSFKAIATTLKRFSRLRAEELALAVDDQRRDGAAFSARLQRADLRLDGRGFELRAELAAPEALATRLRLRAGMTGDLAEPASWAGRWTLDASDLAPAAPLTRYWPAIAAVQWREATLTAAGDWARGAPGASELALRAKALTLAGQPTSALNEIDVGLYYRPSSEGAAPGGTLDVVPLRLTGRKGLWPSSSARLEWQRTAAAEGAAAALQWRASSTFLRLDDLAPWLAALLPPHKQLPPAFLRSLAGDVSALEARWQPRAGQPPRYSLHARLVGGAATWPGKGQLKGLSGEITADEASGRITIDEKPLDLELPTLFSTPLRGLQLATGAEWRRAESGWQVSVPEFRFSLLGSTGSGNAELSLPDAAPAALKLQTRFDVADVAALKPLMPRHWGEPLKNWLQRAVVRGRIAKGSLAIEGPLRDFPFHKAATGRFALMLPLSGGRLEFHPEWPGVDQFNATLRFAGNGLTFEGQRGVISGVAVTAVQGGIADFAMAPLVLDAVTVGEAPYYYAFLRASPLANRLSALLRQSEAEGPVQADVHVEVPLHSNLGQKTVARGTVLLKGNNLRHAALERPVRDITGRLQFGSSVSAEGLTATLHDTPLNARIAPGADGSDTLFASAAIDPRADDGLAARYLPGWLAARLTGSSDWRVEIPLSGPASGRVRLASTLQGTAVALPAPLGKAADELRTLQLDITGDDSQSLAVTGDMEGRLGLALRFARARTAAAAELRAVALRLGASGVPALPKGDGVQIEGVLDVLDPVDWRGVVEAITEGSRRGGSSADAGLAFAGADLQVQNLRVAGYDIPQVRLRAIRDFGGYTATLQGEGGSGSVKLATNGEALSARFASLQLIAAPKQPSVAGAAASEPTDPTRAPTVDVAVDALRIGGRPFGALALATERSANGQRLRRFSLNGGIATGVAEGEWRRSQGMTEAQSRFTLTSDDLAGTLEGLGFAATVAGRNARIEGDLTWPAAARGFDWAQGRGTVSLAVEDGALRTVEPGGGGRVLGLFNFYALPRRLALDFGDVVAQGLGFDRIEGSFKLAGGVARTENLTVRGPSVNIEVRGAIGLAARDYNQIITVTPNTKGITLGALLLGGATAVAAPVLPLIAVIANQVIDKPLGQVTQLSYGLTGSWENPEIKKIDALTAEAGSNPEPPAEPAMEPSP